MLSLSHTKEIEGVANGAQRYLAQADPGANSSEKVRTNGKAGNVAPASYKAKMDEDIAYIGLWTGPKYRKAKVSTMLSVVNRTERLWFRSLDRMSLARTIPCRLCFAISYPMYLFSLSEDVVDYFARPVLVNIFRCAKLKTCRYPFVTQAT